MDTQRTAWRISSAEVNTLIRYTHIPGWLLARLPGNWLGALLRSAAAAYAARVTPRQGLQWLLALDQDLYQLQGGQAIKYNQGLHPKHRLTSYHDFFIRHLQPGQQVLDVGCGNGALAADMAGRAGVRVMGMDCNPVSIDTARREYAHPGVEYRLGDVLTELPSRTYDVVVLSNVLEHLPERSDFLRRVVALAHPSKLLLRVPSFERDWRVPLKREVGVEWRLDPTHETEYTQEAFQDELTAAGLVISEWEFRWGELWAVAMPDGS